MKITAVLLLSLVFVNQAYANPSDGFLHMRMKNGKFEKLNYRHGQLDVGAVLTKSKLMNVKIRDGGSFVEYRAESKDGKFTIIDSVGFGSSSFLLDLKDITEMVHADYFYKDYKWELSGPSIDSLYNVLAELDEVDEENVILKSYNNQNNDAAYSIGIGTGKNDISCYVNHGGNGQPIKNPPVKKCVFTER